MAAAVCQPGQPLTRQISGGSPGPRIIRCAFPKEGGNWGLTVASHLSFSISFKMNCAVNYTATVEVVCGAAQSLIFTKLPPAFCRSILKPAVLH
jgi:hypothetical protein